jgi:hypothetical protein
MLYFGGVGPGFKSSEVKAQRDKVEPACTDMANPSPRMDDRASAYTMVPATVNV